MPLFRPRVQVAAPLTALSLALVAFTAPANAATVAVPAPCVVDYGLALGNVRTLPIVGTGFTPGGVVGLSVNSAADPTPQSFGSTNADSLGGFSGSAFPAAFKSDTTDDQTFNLIAQNMSNPAIPAAVSQFRQVRLSYSTKPGGRIRPGRKVRYTVRGWVPGKNVYLHVRRGSVRKNVKIGMATGACGITSRKLRLLPVANPRNGVYKLYVDQAARFSRNTTLQVRGKITVSTTFSRRRVSLSRNQPPA